MALGPDIKEHSNIGALLQSLSGEKDYERDFDRLYSYTYEDTGIKNTRADCRLKLYGNGDAELLTTDEVGMYVSNTHKSVSLNGLFGHMHFDNLLFTTKEDGLMWNGYTLNPLLRLLCNEEYDLKLLCKDKNNNTFEISPFIKNDKKEDLDLSKILTNRSSFINIDSDDDDIVKHIISITELDEEKSELYKDEEGE